MDARIGHARGDAVRRRIHVEFRRCNEPHGDFNRRESERHVRCCIPGDRGPGVQLHRLDKYYKLRVHSRRLFRWRRVDGIQKGGVAALGAIAYSLNVPYYCVASVDGTAGTYYVLLCNAITGAITEESGSNAISATGGNGTAAVVNLNASPNAFSGSVALVACEFRAMPIEMGRVLVRNTWQPFEPEQIIVKAGAGLAELL